MDVVFRNIKRANSEDAYRNFFLLLDKIVNNILQHEPIDRRVATEEELKTSEKYRRLSVAGKQFQSGVSEVQGAIELLKDIGFKRTIIDFKEYYEMSPLSTTARCKLNDFYIDLQVVVTGLRAKEANAENIKSIAQMNRVRESEIERIMRGFEEDRLEKEEKNRREHAKLQKKSIQRSKEEVEKMAEVRARMVTRLPGTSLNDDESSGS